MVSGYYSGHGLGLANWDPGNDLTLIGGGNVRKIVSDRGNWFEGVRSLVDSPRKAGLLVQLQNCLRLESFD